MRGDSRIGLWSAILTVVENKTVMALGAKDCCARFKV